MTGNDVAELSEDELELVVAAGDRPLIVDIYAPWCAPCKAGAPMFAKVAGENASVADFVKINLDSCTRLLEKWSIRALPTVIVVRGEEVVWRANDLRATTLAQAVAEARGGASAFALPLPFGGSPEAKKRALAELEAAARLDGDQPLDQSGVARRWASLIDRAGGQWKAAPEALALPDLMTDLFDDASSTSWSDAEFARFVIETLAGLPVDGFSPQAQDAFYELLVSDRTFGLISVLAPRSEVAGLLQAISRSSQSADLERENGASMLRRKLVEINGIDDEDRLLLGAAIDARVGKTPARIADFSRRLRRAWLLRSLREFSLNPDLGAVNAEYQAVTTQINIEMTAAISAIDAQAIQDPTLDTGQAKRALYEEITARHIPEGSPVAAMLAQRERATQLQREQQLLIHRTWLERAVAA